MSASAFSLSALVPVEGFRVVRGEPVVGGLKGPDINHFFCPDCMTWMFTRFPGLPHVVNVRSTMFDDAAFGDPFLETMTAEKLPWVTTPAPRSYEGFPSMEDFAVLMEQFAAAQA